MIWIGDKRIERLFVGTAPVAAIFIGAVKVWEVVTSCFASGKWMSSLPWRNNHPWR